MENWVKHLTALHPNHPETVDFYFRISRVMYNLALASLKDRHEHMTLPFKDVTIKKYPKDTDCKQQIPHADCGKL
ncbi:MAG: hypothetical protein ACLRUW_17180 [Bacteroides faecis]